MVLKLDHIDKDYITPKLIVPVNNVLVISNHQINDILNLSQDVSQYKIELKVILSGSLTHVEEVLRRELEPIRKRNDRIITLSYLGVTSLGGGYAMTAPSTVTLAIGAYCRQSDMYDVSLYLNREIKLLCEREGLTII